MRSNDGEGEPGKGLNAMFNFLNKKDRTPPVLPEGTVRRRYTITGQVQGVGFRYRARYAAQTLDLSLIHISEPRDMRRSRMPSSA